MKFFRKTNNKCTSKNQILFNYLSLLAGTKSTYFLRTSIVSCLTALGCSFSSLAVLATPNANWSIQSTVTDCYGMIDESYGVSGTPCQNYQEDLYENWDPNDGGHGDTDIKTFSVGEDSTYYYFKIDLREDWTSESRKYYVEIEANGDGQSDYFLVYQPKVVDLGSSWRNIGGNGEIEIYEDQNDSIGGSNPIGSDNGDPDGYESDLSYGKNLNSGDFFVRLIDGDVQMALKKNTIGSPSNILSRAFASQNTNLSPNKLTWHDQNTVSDFDGAGGFDSSASADTNTWLELNPPSVSSNQPPDAINDTVYSQFETITVNALANDIDPDLASQPDEILTITSVENPDGGSALIDNNGMIVFTPTDGLRTYTFEYTISDNSGETDTATITINLFAVD